MELDAGSTYILMEIGKEIVDGIVDGLVGQRAACERSGKVRE